MSESKIVRDIRTRLKIARSDLRHHEIKVEHLERLLYDELKRTET